MIGFPSSAKIFFPQKKNAAIVVDQANIQTVEIDIKGMSCIACEEDINHEINKLQGIVESIVSYKNRSAVIKFDVSKTTIKDITDAVKCDRL
jgi:mercuric ion transport protein